MHEVIFRGSDLYGLLIYYAISIPAVFYSVHKLSNWLGEYLIVTVERITAPKVYEFRKRSQDE